MLQRVSLALDRLIESSQLESNIGQISILLTDQLGSHGGYWGRQLENPGTLELFIVWESFSSYSGFSASPSSPQFSVLLSSLSTSYTTYLADISPTLPTTVLTAPVVEVLTFSNLTSDRHLDPVRLPNFRRRLGECGGWRGDAVGPGLDLFTGKEAAGKGDDEVSNREGSGRSWLILGGWESVEAHKGFQASEAFKERPGVDGQVQACHVVFSRMGA